MPRIRSIKPDFYSDPDLGRLSLEARYLYQSLWVFADDHGRMAGDPRLIKSQSFPFDDKIPTKKVTQLLDELATAGKVNPYEHEGIAYLHLPNFTKHQRIDRPQPPKHPDPDHEGSANGRGPVEDQSTLDRKGREGKGSESTSSTSSKTGSTTPSPGVDDAIASLEEHFKSQGFIEDDVLALGARLRIREQLGKPVTDPLAWMQSALASMARTRSADPGEAKVIELNDGSRMKLENGQWEEVAS